MQEGEGKATRKSDEIAPTLPRGHLAEVTPHRTVNERAQAKAKKKKGLEGYFGTGAWVPPPNREGTPIDAVGKRRGEEDRTNARTAGGGGRTPDQGHREKSNKKGDKRGKREKSIPNLEGLQLTRLTEEGGGRTRQLIVQEGRERAQPYPWHGGTKATQTREGRAIKRGIDKNLHPTRKGLLLAQVGE